MARGLALAGRGTRVPIVTTWANGDDGTCVEFAPSVALLAVQYAKKLNQVAALLGVIGLFLICKPGGHGPVGDHFEFGDVDFVLAGRAIGILTYDKAKDVNKEDDSFYKRC